MIFRAILFLILISFHFIGNSQDQIKQEPSMLKKQLNFMFIDELLSSPIDSVDVFVFKEGQQTQSFNSGNTGNLTALVEPGIYSVSFKRHGYNDKVYSAFKVQEKGVGMFRIVLTRKQ